MTCSEAIEEYGQNDLCIHYGLGKFCAQSCNYRECTGEPNLYEFLYSTKNKSVSDYDRYVKLALQDPPKFLANSGLPPGETNLGLDYTSCSEAIQELGEENACLEYGSISILNKVVKK